MLIKINQFKKHTANLITLLNLSLGIFAIFYVSNQRYFSAAILIIIAGMTDRLDGYTARKFHIVSDLGKHLDSLSDMVSFGLAPALLLYFSTLQKYKIIGLIITFIYILCGAYRLGRYNVTNFKGYYTGLPITISGILLAIIYLLHAIIPSLIIMVTVPVISYLMISRISLKKR